MFGAVANLAACHALPDDQKTTMDAVAGVVVADVPGLGRGGFAGCAVWRPAWRSVMCAAGLTR